MKRFCVFVMIALFMLTISGCGNTKIINRIEYDTYGFLNKDEKRNPDIEYDLIIGNIVWACILVETIIVPIYFLGFSLYEPVGIKDYDKPKGSI